jgi:two-component system, sensor histidine kinase and response regulator
MKKSFDELRELCAPYGVLFVDDDDSVLNSMRSVLSPIFGHSFFCSSFDEAVELFLKNKKNIHVVIVDIVLKDKSGMDLLEYIRQKDQTKKFIVASGYGSNEYISRAMELGVGNFLLKPIDTKALFVSVRLAVDRVKLDSLMSENIARLKKAKKQAEELLKKQDRFIKDAIHELSTPLSIIMSAKDLVVLEKGDSVHLNSIEAACKSLQNSFEDMTYLMKKDFARFPNEKINICEFVKERAEFFRSIAEANRLNIQVECESPEFFFKIPPIKLQRLIDNNISNAIKYSNRQSTIKISVSKKQDSYCLEFESFGKQIADKKKIFERFHREDVVKGGYGIGLSLIAEICAEFEISIEVQSEKDGETVFSYFFHNAPPKAKRDKLK